MYSKKENYSYLTRLQINVYTALFSNTQFDSFLDTARLQNSRIFCERGRPSICERKAVWRAVWSECENGEGEWGETRVRLARFTSEDRACAASRPPKTSENDCFAV